MFKDNVLPKTVTNITAILPAAGIGSRMYNSLPKQYITICNKTILEHAFYAILQQSCICEIIIVISSNDHWFEKLLIASHPLVKVVIGGGSRSESVMSAIRYITNTEWVLIHDAVRPCLRQIDLIHLLEIITKTKVGGILATPIQNTIKYSFSDTRLITYTINNNNLWHALTPQLFMYDVLKQCLEKVFTDGIKITDESSALEYCGYQPLLVPGYSDNIKITNPTDLTLAQFLLTNILG